jgi:hypothetical protein
VLLFEVEFSVTVMFMLLLTIASICSEIVFAAILISSVFSSFPIKFCIFFEISLIFSCHKSVYSCEIGNFQLVFV